MLQPNERTRQMHPIALVLALAIALWPAAAQAHRSASVADADHAYHLPNVPFVQYYREGGYAIHRTYWHDHFGLVESQGCINLTWTDSAYLFTLPSGRSRPKTLPAGQSTTCPRRCCAS